MTTIVIKDYNYAVNIIGRVFTGLLLFCPLLREC